MLKSETIFAAVLLKGFQKPI